MLKFNEFVPYAPDRGQIHINHENCSAGTDTKERLYIRRDEDGRTILAYCHHCGGSGCYRGYVVPFEQNGTVREHDESRCRTHVTCPDGEGIPYEDWPIRAQVWLQKYGVTRNELLQYRIYYSPSDLRIVIPNFCNDVCNLYQLRAIHPDQKPKYITRTSGKTSSYWMASSNHKCDMVVLAEDAISAIILGRVFNSVALLSNAISDCDLKEIVTNYKRFVVWLDNDSIDINDKALNLKRRLELYGTTIMITGYNDPKYYGDRCKEIIDNACTNRL